MMPIMPPTSNCLSTGQRTSHENENKNQKHVAPRSQTICLEQLYPAHHLGVAVRGCNCLSQKFLHMRTKRRGKLDLAWRTV